MWNKSPPYGTLLKLVPTDKYLSAQKSLFQNKCWNIAVVQVNNALDVGREEAFAGLTVKISKNLTCRNEIQRSGSFSKVYFNATYYQNVSTQYLLQINNYAGRYRCFGNSFLVPSSMRQAAYCKISSTLLKTSSWQLLSWSRSIISFIFRLANNALQTIATRYHKPMPKNSVCNGILVGKVIIH